MTGPDEISRRAVLQGAAVVLPAALLLAACGEEETGAATSAGNASLIHAGEASMAAYPTGTLAATPACADDDEPTEAQTEGPYFTPGSPLRASLLAPGVRGVPLVVTGRVLSTSCRPRARALIDVWQADGNGVYDNRGYRLRGHQFTDAQGRFRLSTVVPGLYPGRTRHIHVKVQPRGGRVLTTQLYFPRVSRNATDPIFDAALLMKVTRTGVPRRATFDFVV